ncbi:hypothetical protein MTR67_019162, partial [Solanum verrucosum]
MPSSRSRSFDLIIMHFWDMWCPRRSFSTTASSLNRLTRQSVSFQWFDECEGRFQKLKTLLTSAPLLTLPEEETRYSLVEQIREHQFDDAKLCLIQDKVLRGEDKKAILDSDGVFRIRGMICVPKGSQAWVKRHSINSIRTGKDPKTPELKTVEPPSRLASRAVVALTNRSGGRGPLTSGLACHHIAPQTQLMSTTSPTARSSLHEPSSGSWGGSPFGQPWRAHCLTSTGTTTCCGVNQSRHGARG